MWKFIFAVLVIFAVLKLYPSLLNVNPQAVQKSATQEIKSEKTIFKVNQTREMQDKAVQEALNR